MESASPWTVSHTGVSVWRVTVAPSVTSRESCSILAVACPVNMAAARSQTQEMPFVIVKVATLENFVMQVGLLCVCVSRKRKVMSSHL